MPGHLNDLSGPMRRTTAVQGGGLGVMLGSLATIGTDQPGLFGGLLFTGLFMVVAAIVWQSAWLRSAEKALRKQLEVGAAELASGTVTGERAVGRVVRRRIARTSPSWSTAGPDPVPAPSMVLVVTALTAAGARRVAVLVPAQLGLESRKAPVAILVHPTRPEVAIVDVAPGADEIEQSRADPRWDTLSLPTDSTVAGGYLRLAGGGALALVIGAALAVLLVAVLR